MTDGRPPKPVPLRDRWALMPPPLMEAALGVLYAALERRAPFEAIELSSFDVALSELPPPPGLAPEQVRRGVFEELNVLPWSQSLKPPEGGSWRKHIPIELFHKQALDKQTFAARPRDYRFTRKVAKRVADAMRADGTLAPDVGVELDGEFAIFQGRQSDVRVFQSVEVAYQVAPYIKPHVSIFFSKQDPSCAVQPPLVFLDPKLRGIASDKEAERVIRQA